MDNVEKMIIDQCRNIGLELNMPAICQVVDVHSELLTVEQPVFTFLDLSGQPDHLSVIAEYLCEKDILRKCVGSLRTRENWSIRLVYGKEEAWYIGERLPEHRISPTQIENDTPDSLIIVYPSERLKNRTVVLLSSGDHRSAYDRELTASGKLFLLTHATMVLPEAQVNWITEFEEPYFDADRFYICLLGTEQLPDESQEEQIAEYIRQRLGGPGSIKLLKSQDEIVRAISEQDISGLAIATRKRLLHNLIAEISNILDHMLTRYSAKKEEYIQVGKQLESYRVRLNAAAEIAAENRLDNQIKDMIAEIDSSVREYSTDMCETIRQAILSAKDPEEADMQIGPYMERSWEFFSERTSQQITRDFDVIQRELAMQMEEDLYDVLQQMELPSQNLMESLLPDGMDICSQNPHYQQTENSALREVSRNTRNTVLLSIPLLFVSRTLSAVTLLGGTVYSRLDKKKAEKNYRTELLNQAEATCRRAGREVSHGFTQTLENEQKKMRDLVVAGYGRFLDTLLDELKKRSLESEDLAEKAVHIRKILDEELPDLRQRLEKL